MNLKHRITVSFLFISMAAFCQLPSLLKNKDTDSTGASGTDSASKKQSKDVVDFFIGGGFVFGPSDNGDKIQYGASREFAVGMGYARMLFKWNAIGIDAYYKSTGYYLTQDSSKILPNTNLHNSEKISFDNLGGLIFDRFYFGKVFFDGGFYTDWVMVSKHVTNDYYTVANVNGGSSTHSVDRQLVFLNDYNYGLTFRFGKVNGVVLYFNYRLTNVFTKGTTQGTDMYYNLPLPPYVIGLVIGTF